MEQVIIEGEIRDLQTSKNVKALRREGKIPGIVYSSKREPLPIMFDQKNIAKLVQHETGMITVRVNKEEIPGIVRELQYDPVSDYVIHIDILGVDVTQVIRVSVPVVLEGIPISVKASGGILNHITREIEIECLPMDIPERLSVSVIHLEIGDAVHVSDMTFDKGKILERPDTVIATVVPPTIEKEVAPVEAAVEGEEGAEKAAEGEEGKEGKEGKETAKEGKKSEKEKKD